MMTVAPMPNRSSIRLTYEDYCEIPDDGKRYQLVDGELFVTPAPFTRHQRLLRRLFKALDAHVSQAGSGEVFFAPVDVLLEEGTVVQPDVLFISNSRADIVTAKHVTAAPDLVVEVLSDGSRRLDEKKKLGVYERYGVVECWYVDPEMDVVRVYRREGDRFLPPVELAADRRESLSSPLFPGLVIPCAALFL